MAEASPQKSPAEALEEILQLVRSVLRRSKRYWPVLAVSVVLAAVAAWLAPRLLWPVYQSEVVLEFREGIEPEDVLGLRGGGESPRSRNESLREFLLSPPTLREIIEKERLTPDRVAELGMPRVVETLRPLIGFSAGEGSTIIIRYADKSPELAQRVARRMGDLVRAYFGRQYTERAATTRKFLTDEEGKLAEELRSSEAEYAVFVAQHPEFAPVRGTGQPGAVTSKTAIPSSTQGGPSNSLAALQRQAFRLRARLERIRNPNAPALPPPDPPAQGLTPESRDAIAAATRDVKLARDEYDALQAKFTSLHPDVRRAEANLSAREDELRRVKVAAVTAARPAYEQAISMDAPPDPNEEETLARQLSQVEVALAKSSPSAPSKADEPAPGIDGAQAIVNMETHWAELSRRLEMVREQHEAMQRRLFNAIVMDKAQTRGGGREVVVVEEAYLPKLPSARGPRRTSAGAAFLFLLLGASGMVGLGFLDQRVLSEWDLARLGLAPIAVVIPRITPGTKRTGDD